MLMRTIFAALLGLAPLLPAASQTLDMPVGGWNQAGLVDRSREPAANYPYALINRGVQRNRTMIRGRLAAAGKQRPFHTLVVNGNLTPLYNDDEGRFARGYTFGRGANSVEIRSRTARRSSACSITRPTTTRPRSTCTSSPRTASTPPGCARC